MKKISNILARMESFLNGSLDGLELDNKDDVIEKSTVIEMVKDLKMLVNEAQQHLNIPISKLTKVKNKIDIDNPNAPWNWKK